VNFYSRVQMYLFKARQAAEAEVQSALAEKGLDSDALRQFLEAHPSLSRALHRSPHAGGCTTTDLVHEAAYVKTTPAWRRAAKTARVAAKLAGKGALSVASGVPHALALSVRAAAELREIARDKGPAALDESLAKVKARLIEVAFGLSESAGSSLAAAAG
jgi:hypothetical protein